MLLVVLCAPSWGQTLPVAYSRGALHWKTGDTVLQVLNPAGSKWGRTEGRMLQIVDSLTGTIDEGFGIENEPAALAWSPDGSKLYIAAMGCVARYSLADRSYTLVAKVPDFTFTTLAVSPDGSKAAGFGHTSTSSAYVVFPTEGGAVSGPFDAPDSYADLFWSGSSLLVTNGPDLYDLNGNRLRDGDVYGPVTVSPDGSLATALEDQVITTFRVSDGAVLGWTRVDGFWARRIAYMDGGRALAVSGDEYVGVPWNKGSRVRIFSATQPLVQKSMIKVDPALTDWSFDVSPMGREVRKINEAIIIPSGWSLGYRRGRVQAWTVASDLSSSTALSKVDCLYPYDSDVYPTTDAGHAPKTTKVQWAWMKLDDGSEFVQLDPSSGNWSMARNLSSSRTASVSPDGKKVAGDGYYDRDVLYAKAGNQASALGYGATVYYNWKYRPCPDDRFDVTPEGDQLVYYNSSRKTIVVESGTTGKDVCSFTPLQSEEIVKFAAPATGRVLTVVKRDGRLILTMWDASAATPSRITEAEVLQEPGLKSVYCDAMADQRIMLVAQTTGPIDPENDAERTGSVISLYSGITGAKLAESRNQLSADGWKNVRLSVDGRHIYISAANDSLLASLQTPGLQGVNAIHLPSGQLKGGSAYRATVTLDFTPDVPYDLKLSVSNPVLTVPAKVTVPAGKNSVNFDIKSVGVDADTTVILTAASEYDKASVNIMVMRARSVSLAFDPPLAAGDISLCSIILDAAAGPSGVKFSLPYGSGSAGLDISSGVFAPQTNSVSCFALASPDPASLKGSVAFKLSSAISYAPYTMLPPVLNLKLNASSVKGGTAVPAAVELRDPAPEGGVVVSLASSGGGVVSPSTVTVKAGQTRYTFSFVTSPVPVTTTTAITASAPSLYASMTRNLWLYPPVWTSFSSDVTTVKSGGTVTFTVGIDSPAPEGFTLPMQSTNNRLLPVSSGAVFSAGAKTATVAVKAGAVSANTYVRVSSGSTSIYILITP